MPWDEFRPTLERAWRKPMDAVLMFKMLVLSAFYKAPRQTRYMRAARLGALSSKRWFKIKR